MRVRIVSRLLLAIVACVMVIVMPMSCQPTVPPFGDSEKLVGPDGRIFDARAAYTITEQEGMNFVRWSVQVENNGVVQATRLIIDCVGDDYKILAEDDVVCTLKPGETEKRFGGFDIPTDILPYIRGVFVTLVRDTPQ